MNLDNVKQFAIVDTEMMIDHIDGLPDQLAIAWELGQSLSLPPYDGIRQVVVAGMGGSAIGADLLAAYESPLSSVPILVWRNYELPAFAGGQETLVIACSHSGNTEEALSAFERAQESGARLMAITTGGELARRAISKKVPLWQFDHDGQPRTAVGYSFGLLFSALVRLHLVPNPGDELANCITAMKAQQANLRAEVPIAENLAKQKASQLVGRCPIIIGSGFMRPVARRWRTQIAELSKSVAQFEELPEADHNMLSGVLQPKLLFDDMMVLFLRAEKAHPRNEFRSDLTRQILADNGFRTDNVTAEGDSRLAQQWTCLHFGDYTSYYLAMAYDINPTPVAAIESLKARLKQA